MPKTITLTDAQELQLNIFTNVIFQGLYTEQEIIEIAFTALGAWVAEQKANELLPEEDKLHEFDNSFGPDGDGIHAGDREDRKRGVHC